ncbi:hypothetical protein [Nocardiopsis sp. CC223A]|uniref:hypothetical protein n=1 Tax=Nocardiopsis sp. CC223A TaxID=3044051 RepID=UPI00279572A7|nr:hypothetical protein [Nocardiopsis sp. CC223A]
MDTPRPSYLPTVWLPLYTAYRMVEALRPESGGADAFDTDGFPALLERIDPGRSWQDGAETITALLLADSGERIGLVLSLADRLVRYARVGVEDDALPARLRADAEAFTPWDGGWVDGAPAALVTAWSWYTLVLGAGMLLRDPDADADHGVPMMLLGLSREAGNPYAETILEQGVPVPFGEAVPVPRTRHAWARADDGSLLDLHTGPRRESASAPGPVPEPGDGEEALPGWFPLRMSDSAREAARASRLGPLRRIHRIRGRAPRLLRYALLLAALVGLPAGALLHGDPSWQQLVLALVGGFGVLGAGFAAFVLWGGIAAPVGRAARVGVYDGGFVLDYRSHATALPWDGYEVRKGRGRLNADLFTVVWEDPAGKRREEPVAGAVAPAALHHTIEHRDPGTADPARSWALRRTAGAAALAAVMVFFVGAAGWTLNEARLYRAAEAVAAPAAPAPSPRTAPTGDLPRNETELADFCRGDRGPFTDAAPYQGPGPHPMRFSFSDTGRAAPAYSVPDEEWDADDDRVELVACVRFVPPDGDPVDCGRYSLHESLPATVPVRVRPWEVQVTVYGLRDGDEVLDVLLRGDDTCPESALLAEGAEETVLDGYPTTEQYEEALNGVRTADAG